MDSTQLALLALLAGAVVGGSIVGVLVLAARVRRQAEADASAEMPELVRAVMRGMDDTVLVVDASATVVAASDLAAGFGVREGEALADDDLRALVRTARDAHTVSTTLRLRRTEAPRESRLTAVRATRISPRLTLVVIRDITERERVEEMRRDFVANTSHELKTPVGAVSLLAEAIESAADDPAQVRIFSARLSAEASRLATLTSRIMNLSRLQAADDSSELRDVSVDEVVTSAVEAHAMQAASARVQIVRGGSRGLHVRGDGQVLTEALGNLLANAIAYSPAGSKVGVGVTSVDGMVEIAVTDRGIGIAEADQERVFERFYRADQARSRRTGGTGLGLSIVKHAVQRHGGEVRLWSRPGRGSTFTMRLPAVAAPVDERPRGHKKGQKPVSRPRRPRAATTNGDAR